MAKKAKDGYDRPTTIICKDTKIETAKLSSTSNVQISGKFYGDVDITASLVIGETGSVVGNIKAEFILLAGEVQGNIEVAHQLHITSTARVKGDVIAATVIIDEGAHLEGGIKMSDRGSRTSKTPAKEVVAENKPANANKSSGIGSMFD